MKTSALKNRHSSQTSKNRKAILSPDWQFMFFVLGLIVIFLLIYQTYYKTPYTATALYFDFASKVLHGSIPYRDFVFEYPPVALVFFILPRLVTSTYTIFAAIYQAEVLIFCVLGLFIIYKIAVRLGKAPWKLMLVYTICLLAIGPITAQQFDIFPAVLVLLSLFCFWSGHHKASWALLALGTLTKVFPAVIAPILLLYYIRNRQYRLAWSGVITFGLICLVVALPFLTTGHDAIWNLIRYHVDRGVQIESTYGSLLLMADKLGWTSVQLVFNFGSWNVDSPLANALAKASTYIMVLLLVIAYGFIYSQMKPGKSQFSRIGAYSILVTCIVLISSKILSPQYLIWLVPLVPLIFNPRHYTILFTFIVIGALTYFIFPTRYLVLLNLDTGLIGVLVARDVLLIILTILAGVSLRRMKSSE